MAERSRRILFTFATETLNDVQRRQCCRPPDQLLLGLLDNDRVGDVVVADPWRSWVPQLFRRRSLRRVSDVELQGRSLILLSPLRVSRSEPRTPSRLRSLYVRYGQFLHKYAGDVDILVSAHPAVAAWSAPRIDCPYVYFARDDWFEHSSGFRSRTMEFAQNEIGKSQATVFAVSETIGQMLRPDGDYYVVANGVVEKLWLERRARPAAVPPDLVYALYSGTIDSRLDVDLVRQVASHPGVDRTILAGPVGSSKTESTLTEMQGVQLMGNLGQEDLVALTQHASVGIVPHAVNRQTTGANPLKVYEYLAAGIPVISTDIPAVRSIGSRRVECCRRIDDWPAAIDRALAAAALPEQERCSSVRSMSWERRFEPMIESIISASL